MSWNSQASMVLASSVRTRVLCPDCGKDTTRRKRITGPWLYGVCVCGGRFVPAPTLAEKRAEKAKKELAALRPRDERITR